MPHTLEQTIAALLKQEPALQQWLEQVRALTKDGHGGTVIAGLSAGETEEFLRLSPKVQARDSGMTSAAVAVAKERYAELREKLDAALQDNAIEGLSGWSEAAARG